VDQQSLLGLSSGFTTQYDHSFGGGFIYLWAGSRYPFDFIKSFILCVQTLLILLTVCTIIFLVRGRTGTRLRAASKTSHRGFVYVTKQRLVRLFDCVVSA